MPASIQTLFFQWGWITPGTNRQNRHEQGTEHVRFLSQKITPTTRRLLFTHCGWWLDRKASAAVLALTADNPEPNRAISPAPHDQLKILRDYIRRGRLEFLLYPYAACVSEATTGEALLRSFRLSLTAARQNLGTSPRVLLNHDAVYNLDWTTVQMPQIARILDIGMIMSLRDGWVRGLDGTLVRTFGRNRMRESLMAKRAVANVLFFPSELYPSICLFKNWRSFLAEHLNARPAGLRAMTLDQYWQARLPRKKYDCRRLGSKSWYGGTVDSLALEQAVKQVEIRLPALEAAQMFMAKPAAVLTEPARLDFWKKTLILMDNHILWMCHDFKRHFLPQALKLHSEAARLEKTLLGGNGSKNAITVFNPTPWKRDLVVCDGRKTFRAKDVTGWGTQTVTRPLSNRRRNGRSDRLENGRIQYWLNEIGELVKMRQDGRGRSMNGFGRLVRIHEIPSREQGFCVPNDCVLFDAAKRDSHNPYRTNTFLRANGEYVFHYALRPPVADGHDLFSTWKTAQEYALPAGAAAGQNFSPGLRVSPATVVVTALEPCPGGLTLRAVNMSPRRVTARVDLPFAVAPRDGGAHCFELIRQGRTIRFSMGGWRVEEISLKRFNDGYSA